MAGVWSARWDRVVKSLSPSDLLLDIAGKMLVGLGIGALLATLLLPSAWMLIGLGIGMSAVVKAKYWKLFWADGP